jgi:2-methylcitrate dehydratase PrpD
MKAPHSDVAKEVPNRAARFLKSIERATLQLRREHQLHASEVRHADVEIFDVAYKIIGGGEEDDKLIVHTKEQADHSLPSRQHR